ncbi:hypothetical protein T8K17_09555 [Thalassobaculum sp. OXR-137]|uniref:hypothetical protein n=1 Tax=Thalassobaculum sp. OXR-137 TaxID=3100173 RepID=UPI002AC93F8E|nr:hypothetical protein [Thalassobaculum sp. OXR-137]WPZ36381.1 hypothetical protein T8K17_09555 [Thalassobaculum sp. OXR-137]
MRLDDTVTVECTDTDQKLDAQVVRMQGDRVDVMVSGLILSLRRTKPGIYVGTRSGMEFVLKTK